MSEYKPTEVDRLAQIIRTADGNHDMGAGALAEAIADSGFLYEIRADERTKLQDRIEELEKNLSYEVEQKIKLADTLRDERAKRPDREQIARIQFEIDNVHQIHGDTCLCGFKSSRSRSRTEHLTALFAEAVLALEPEAREITDAEIEAEAREMYAADESEYLGRWPEWDSPKNVCKARYLERAEAALEACPGSGDRPEAPREVE